jgi:hypothetical protein
VSYNASSSSSFYLPTTLSTSITPPYNLSPRLQNLPHLTESTERESPLDTSSRIHLSEVVRRENPAECSPLTTFAYILGFGVKSTSTANGYDTILQTPTSGKGEKTTLQLHSLC